MIFRSLKALSIVVLAAGFVVACDDGHLRGEVTRSEDGKTYFGVIDDNGGQCGPIFLDGQEWPHAIGETAEISPGRHTIECGGSISFDVPEGVIFMFDYWGP